MRLVYFAWVREGLGRGEEDRNPPAAVTTVATLLAWLRDQGETYAATLKDEGALRFAVNQVHAQLDTAISPGDEVAIFPPVTGG